MHPARRQHGIILAAESQIGRGETDRGHGARDLAATRTPSCSARSATSGWRPSRRRPAVPVINGLSDGGHPVQVLTDLFTIEERLGLGRGQDAGVRRRLREQHGALVRGGRGHLRLHAAARRAGRLPAARGRVKRRAAGCTVIARPRRPPCRARTWSSRTRGRAWARRRRRRSARRTFRLPGERGAGGAREPGRHRPALPAGAPRRGNHRRGDGRPAVRHLGRGREPHARPEGAPGAAHPGLSPSPHPVPLLLHT